MPSVGVSASPRELSVDVAVKFGEARDRCTVPGQPLVGKGTRDGLDPVTGGGVTGEDRDLDLRPHAGLGVTARSDHPSPVDLVQSFAQAASGLVEQVLQVLDADCVGTGLLGLLAGVQPQADRANIQRSGDRHLRLEVRRLLQPPVLDLDGSNKTNPRVVLGGLEQRRVARGESRGDAMRRRT